jgi:hypothetical protein
MQTRGAIALLILRFQVVARIREDAATQANWHHRTISKLEGQLPFSSPYQVCSSITPCHLTCLSRANRPALAARDLRARQLRFFYSPQSTSAPQPMEHAHIEIAQSGRNNDPSSVHHKNSSTTESHRIGSGTQHRAHVLFRAGPTVAAGYPACNLRLVTDADRLRSAARASPRFAAPLGEGRSCQFCVAPCL